MKERLARQDAPINELDKACQAHDIAYSKFSDSQRRSIADRALAEQAWRRVTSSDSSLGERAAALAVTAAMKVKNAVGAGAKRRRKRRGTVKRGGGHRKSRNTRVKKGSGARRKSKGSKKKAGKGLYLRPYRNVY